MIRINFPQGFELSSRVEEELIKRDTMHQVNHNEELMVGLVNDKFHLYGKDTLLCISEVHGDNYFIEYICYNEEKEIYMHRSAGQVASKGYALQLMDKLKGASNMDELSSIENKFGREMVKEMERSKNKANNSSKR